jgi:hypothetical protein
MKKSRLGIKLGTRPEQWKSGPDLVAHESYRAWQQCRNQANFRSEPWDLTFDQWQRHWAGLWHRRGRTAQALCITRRDSADAWTDSNVIVITRSSHGLRKKGTFRSLGQGPADVVLDDSWAAKP